MKLRGLKSRKDLNAKKASIIQLCAAGRVAIKTEDGNCIRVRPQNLEPDEVPPKAEEDVASTPDIMPAEPSPPVLAATEEMQAIALRHKPHAVCIVPEKREERTTEGGLEVAKDENRLAHFIEPLRAAGCRLSLFIGADEKQVAASARIGARLGARLRASRRIGAHRGALRRVQAGCLGV